MGGRTVSMGTTDVKHLRNWKKFNSTNVFRSALQKTLSALDCDWIDLATYNYDKYPQINSQASRKKKEKVKKKKKKKKIRRQTIKAQAHRASRLIHLAATQRKQQSSCHKDKEREQRKPHVMSGWTSSHHHACI